MLDHHFAERQYNHGHIYLGPAGAEHVHFYETPHAHSHSHNLPAAPGVNGPESNNQSTEVIYLTPQDGAGQSAVSVAATSLYVDFVSPGLGENHFLFGFTSQDNLPPEIFIPPPKRPPRA
jgi:hypothetical protein